AHIEEEMEQPEEAADILSLHYFAGSEYQPAWRYAAIAAKRAEASFAHLEAAQLYSRALDAGRHLAEIEHKDLVAVQEALGDAWTRAGDFGKASDAYTSARRLAAGAPLLTAALLLKRSKLENKAGKFSRALRWATRARRMLEGVEGPEAAREVA